MDEHRIISLTQGYNIYHFHPQGSTVSFEPGENQVGVELYGHTELSALRYSFSILNNGAIFSKNWVSSPVVWGRVSGKVLLNNGVLPEVKGGVFGAVGWHPTQALTQTLPIPAKPATVR